jgi:hypothetical protein
MNDARFDNLAKLVARRLSRRGALLGLGGAAASLALGSIEVGKVSAKTLPDLHYFALGDSIAAGHGLFDNDGPQPGGIPSDYHGGLCNDCDGSNCLHCDVAGVCGPCVDPNCNPLNPWCDPLVCPACPPPVSSEWACKPCCRQSNRAYPHLVKNALARHFSTAALSHYACTGATSLAADRLRLGGNVSQPNDHRTPMRLLRVQVDATLKELQTLAPDAYALVSLTIGANDFEFATGELVTQLYFRTDRQFDGWATFRSQDIYAEVRKQLGRLLAFKQVVVVLTEVHNPFNEFSFLFTGKNACLFNKCSDRINLCVATLNRYLGQIVKDVSEDSSLNAAHRIATAKIHDEFEKHKSPRPSCGHEPPDVTAADGSLINWIQYRDDKKS